MQTEIKHADFRKKVLNFVSSMKIHSGQVWNYKLSENTESSIFTSCFAIFLRNMFGDLDSLSKSEKLEWINYIHNHQDKETGYFHDSESRLKSTGILHNEDHLNMQLTSFCISALECFDEVSLYPLNFVEKYYNKAVLFKWLSSLNWKRSSNSGNKVMFVAIAFIYNYEKFGSNKAKKALENWFEWMDKKQNPGTGFWSSGTNARYFQGLAGFYHQFVIYIYMNRKINYSERIIDRILYLQQPDGLFYPGNGGGSCQDIDALTPLVFFYKKSDYRRDEIYQAIEKAFSSLLKNQNDDGGFCWAKRDFFSIKTYKYLLLNLFYKEDIYYWYNGIRRFITYKLLQKLAKPTIDTGWTFTNRYETESSLFDTWLRCTTIAEVSQILGEDTFHPLKIKYQKTPGLCWFSKKL
tara:strand:- start:127 stop:1350 length:1224 start_codon:yes stop_codon:yes gene_type:complete